MLSTVAARTGIDSSDNVDRLFEAMKIFLETKTIKGVFQTSPDDPDYNSLPAPARTKGSKPGVVVQFESIQQFEEIHRSASQIEDKLEGDEIDAFNKSNTLLRAWPLAKVTSESPLADKEETWVVLIEVPPSIEARYLPGIGETCQVRLAGPRTGNDASAWWTGRRMPNNFGTTAGGSTAGAGGAERGSDEKKKRDWSHLAVFNVMLEHTGPNDTVVPPVLTALLPDHGEDDREGGGGSGTIRSRILANLTLSSDNAIFVNLFFAKSDATFTAEMLALHKIVAAVATPLPPNPEDTTATIPPNTATAANASIGSSNMPDNPNSTADSTLEDATEVPTDSVLPKKSKPGRESSEADTNPFRKKLNPNAVQPMQVAAFRYMMDFRNPKCSINMFELYPHMRDPEKRRSGIAKAIVQKYERMDKHQRDAYDGLLADMPCGLAFVPGGPGGGKTDWALTVIGLMQSGTQAKVLYLLDINSPLDDATTKYVKMMRQAGLSRSAIRMRNFGTELRNSSWIGSVQKKARASKGEVEVDFSRNFLREYMEHLLPTSSRPLKKPATRHNEDVPTLDEAAWKYYEKHKGKFAELTALLESANCVALGNRALRFHVFLLYQQVLRQASFISTTPCVASTMFHRMFKPDLIVFDEAAHARELSTVIAIANFCPKAGWIFIGDHRQTQPTVRSNRANPFALQLETSTMERAHLAGALKYQLLINHRAYGRLERLPSNLIYGSQMVSGIPFHARFPSSAAFVKDYFQALGKVCFSVPRMIVHLEHAGRPVRVGTSWYHPCHIEWTMKCVLDLVKNRDFRSAEHPALPGRILLLAPYKAAVMEYQNALTKLEATYPGYGIEDRVEARTWDSAQGHEADIVGIDYVRSHITEFMDGMYRFNVGLTRARLGEWHLMHPGIPYSESFRQSRYLRKLYDACRFGVDGLSEGRVVCLPWGRGMPVEGMLPLVSSNLPLPVQSPVAAAAAAKVFPIMDDTTEATGLEKVPESSESLYLTSQSTSGSSRILDLW